MHRLALPFAAALALAGSTGLALAQSNAAVPHGSGAVGTVGPGENPATSGIGGSGSTPPAGAFQPNSSSGVVVPPAPGSAPNASVPYGSGAVSPLGPGESSGSAGIGGSGTSAPRQ
ncbi:MAG TPA: hypothetical protein VFS03_04085 [Microvirga sp.]|nr:hypothetical protein [Microvirga sp.]